MDDETTEMERMYATSFYDVMMDHHYRYHYALRFISRHSFVLDAACGSGYGTNYLAKHSECALAVGTDRSEHALEWALRYFHHEKAVYLNSDLSGDFQADLPIKRYDLIVCFETVEHMRDDRSFVKKLYRCLNDEGILLISAPNENVIPYLKNPYYAGGVNPYHYRHYRPKELRDLLKKCGFQILQTVTQDNETYEVVPGREDGFTTIVVAGKK
ncbi:class I SAM-dependent methyltransferase [Paenibacillus sp. NPDC058071]|uniref:class I SAM-dependent methyltransferase n=1 Tax=Paenibacillus sp. NPDC058071 TaxID=3346326 RepID=UPI0036DAA93A